MRQFTQGRHTAPAGVVFRGRSFRSDEGRLCGLTTGYLRQKYYPRFCLQSAQYEDSVEPVLTVEATEGRSRVAITARARMARGRRVDARVGSALQLMTQGVPPRTFEVEGEMPSTVPAAAKPATRRWLASKCQHARLVFTAVRRLGLEPCAAQVIVADPNSGVGSAADLVCKDSRGAAVLIEMKAISAASMTKYCNSMRGLPLTDCILNQALVQLGATRSLYRRTYPDQALSSKAYVLVVSDRVCHAFVLPGCLLGKVY